MSEVYKRQYTSQDVNFSDIFPNTAKHGGGTAADYIIERTMLRPRDAIQFANECFLLAIGRPRISWRVLNAAESNYSQKRIKSLKEEWAEFYPCLENTIEIVRGLDNPFTRSSISNERLESLAEDIHDGDEKDPCVAVCRNLYAPGSKVSHSEVLSKILISLYHIGVVGVKISTLDTYTWSHVDQPRLTNSEAKRVNSIKVHKMLRHALEIKDRKLLTEMGKKNQD